MIAILKFVASLFVIGLALIIRLRMEGDAKPPDTLTTYTLVMMLLIVLWGIWA